MASTRNKNTMNDYVMEKRMNEQLLSYQQYTNSSTGKAHETNIFNIGSNPNLPRETLSHNPVETESYLFGINATNLEVTKMPFISLPKTIANKSYFKRPNTLVPEPFAYQTNQRPNYLP